MKNYSTLALLAAMPALAWSQPVSAAANAASAGIEEIVVTAQRRVESVQKSSLAIQVLQPEDLARSGVTQPADLARLVPGMQVGTAVGASLIFIRGVGDATSAQTTNPGVSFNINGVNISRPDANGLNFYDLERIEVLKGPQGTLYGRNSTGGAINLLTRKPDFSGFSGFVTFEGGNYALKHGTGALNLPVSDKLALRAAFDVEDRDGYLSDGSNDDKHESGRVSSLWRPSDNFSMFTVIDYAHQHGVGSGSVLYPRPPGSPAFLGTTDPRAIAYIAPQFPSGGDEAFGNPLIGSLGLSGASQGYPAFERLTSWGVSNEFKYDMGWATLTVLPAYREQHIKDRAYIAWQDYHSVQSRQFTTEARLSKDTGKLKWVAGLYYFYEDVKGSIFIDRGNQLTHETLPTNATRSYAGFAQATYSVLKDLRVVTGLRYTVDWRRLNGSQISDVIVRQPPDFAPDVRRGFLETFDGSRRFYALTWKGGLEYDISPNSMAYFTASTGFKSGGINNEPPPNGYGPEKLTAYELGVKNRFLDNKLQVNVEAFKWDYKDHQEGTVALDNAFVPGLLIRNAGAAALYGVDLDIVAKVTRHDTFSARMEYNHARYDSFKYNSLVPPTTGCQLSVGVGFDVDCSRFQLARAPLWTASASWEHVFALANGAELIAFASTQYSAPRWGSVDFTPITRFPSYITGDFDLTYTPEGGRWSLTGFVRNISDEITPMNVYFGSQTTASAQAVGAPRTYGGRVTVNF